MYFYSLDQCLANNRRSIKLDELKRKSALQEDASCWFLGYVGYPWHTATVDILMGCFPNPCPLLCLYCPDTLLNERER